VKIAILGAGAMGSLFSAHLAAAGHDVLLVEVDPAVLRAVEQEGVRIGDRAVRVAITGDPAGHGPQDAVLCLVKTYDTASAARLAQPLVGPSTTVATLQNGIGGADVLAEAFGAGRVVAGVTYQGATVLAPGRIRHHMHGETWIGDDLEAAGPLADALTAAGQVTHAIAPVAPKIWKKLTNNCMGNSTAALTGMNAGQMAVDEGILALQRAIAQEAVAVAAALGHELDLEDCIETNTSILRSSGDGRPSMLQDVEAGRRTEIDTLNGAIVRHADALGIDVPVNRAMVALVSGWERARGLRGGLASSAP
jgi:2-dehydropantoate 2-reductase